MDSSISEAESTMNLDDSDWVPPINCSDDDSIEIVGEVSHTTLRITRSRAAASAAPSLEKCDASKKKSVKGRDGMSRKRSSKRKQESDDDANVSPSTQNIRREVTFNIDSTLKVNISLDISGNSETNLSEDHISALSCPKRRQLRDSDNSDDAFNVVSPPCKEVFKTPTPIGKKRKVESASKTSKKTLSRFKIPLGESSVGYIKQGKKSVVRTKLKKPVLVSITDDEPVAFNELSVQDFGDFTVDLPDVNIQSGHGKVPEVININPSKSGLASDHIPSNSPSTTVKNEISIVDPINKNSILDYAKPRFAVSNRASQPILKEIEFNSASVKSEANAIKKRENLCGGKLPEHNLKKLPLGYDSTIPPPGYASNIPPPQCDKVPVARYDRYIPPGVSNSLHTTVPFNTAIPPPGYVSSNLSHHQSIGLPSSCHPTEIGFGKKPFLLTAPKPSSHQSMLAPHFRTSSIIRNPVPHESQGVHSFHTAARDGHLEKDAPQGDSACSVKLEVSDALDLTSSFEFSPAKRVPVKKRLSLLKKVGRTSAKGSVTKVKSQRVAKSSTVKAVRKAKPIDPDVEVLFEWDPASVISERQGVSEWQARQVISLFDQECTLPFIARYRREKTGDMEIEKLREVQDAYQQLREVRQKVSKVIQDQPADLPDDTRACLLSATTVQEVKDLTASLRTKGKRTLADRARQLGFGEHAEAMLNNLHCALDVGWAQNLVDPKVEGRATLQEVETGLKHIIADTISKDPKMLMFMKAGLKQSNVLLESCQARKVKSQAKAQKLKKVVTKRKSLGGKAPPKPVKKVPLDNIDPQVIAKYERYFDFSYCAWSVRSHMVCAINRGEKQGILTVKVNIPSFAYAKFTEFCLDRWVGSLTMGRDGSFAAPYRRKLLLDTLPDCWDRLVLPSLQSWVRHELSDSAELASIKVFATNLRRLLLTPPVRASTVLAIDPGFSNGCKVAVVERKGKVLAVNTIYPCIDRRIEEAATTLRALVVEYRCEIVCIGNGTACRETEAWLSTMIKQGVFGDVNVQYTIVNESGASQYSVTPEARQEFPDMDVNHISAVSLARRLQDPLLEYVKVPAMHLGVGMYQHDVTNKLLTTSLDSVVMECVSFVGVDLNVASEIVLRKVSGLNKSRAASIVKHREENGPFRSREDLRKVKGIGPVSFQQCAGFVRIVPQTLRRTSSNSKQPTLCALDSTTVHPESYESAKKLLSLAGLNVDDVGCPAFITALRMFVHKETVKILSSKCNCTETTLQVILESLYQPLDFDYRAQFEKPLFRKGVTSIRDLKVGETMTGSVRNVTPFGAFVDIGVGDDGLIHISKMNNQMLQLGNTVLVQILSVEVNKGRIGLMLKEIIG